MSCTFRAGDESRGLAFVIQNYGALSVGSMKIMRSDIIFRVRYQSCWIGKISSLVCLFGSENRPKRKRILEKKKKKVMTKKHASKTLCQVRTGGEDNECCASMEIVCVLG